MPASCEHKGNTCLPKSYIIRHTQLASWCCLSMASKKNKIATLQAFACTAVVHATCSDARTHAVSKCLLHCTRDNPTSAVLYAACSHRGTLQEWSGECVPAPGSLVNDRQRACCCVSGRLRAAAQTVKGKVGPPFRQTWYLPSVQIAPPLAPTGE